KAHASLESADFRMAKKQFDATSELLDHFDKLDVWRSWPTWRNSPQTVKALLAKLRELHFGPDLEEVRARVRDKGHMAEMYAQTRGEPGARSRPADGRRSPLLLGHREELPEPALEVKKPLEPFYVLPSHDWPGLEHILFFLDPPRLRRLRVDVNELLFLWM